MTLMREYEGENYECDIEAIIEQCVQDSDAWFPELAENLPYMMMCTSGEIGELQNLMKKVQRGSLAMDMDTRFNMVMEATDAFIYLMHVFAILKYSPAFAYHVKRAVNAERFGSGSPDSNGGGVVEQLRSVATESVDEGSV